VTEALADSAVAELSVPTLAAGETWQDVAAAATTVDPEALGQRGLAFERLDQLALEHLYGVR
jgi:xylose isomerase